MPRMIVAALVAASALLVVNDDPARAQGDARFCASYAANMAGVADGAIKKNPACLDYSRGVHNNYQNHFEWCMRTAKSSVRGAEAHIRRLVAQCTGNAPQPAPARAQRGPGCPGGERPLPETRLCPSEAISAFLSQNVKRKAELHQGCSYWVNETNMAGSVLLYGALRCGNWLGKLEYVPGAKPAKLTARTKDGTPDVEVIVLKANASDPKATINSFARNAIKDPTRRRECVAQDNPNVPGAIIFDLDKRAAARLRPEGPSGGECGPYGDSNGPNHWRSFGGHVWYFGITDSEHSFDPGHMVLLERDTRGGGLKGWRVKY